MFSVPLVPHHRSHLVAPRCGPCWCDVRCSTSSVGRRPASRPSPVPASTSACADLGRALVRHVPTLVPASAPPDPPNDDEDGIRLCRSPPRPTVGGLGPPAGRGHVDGPALDVAPPDPPGPHHARGSAAPLPYPRPARRTARPDGQRGPAHDRPVRLPGAPAPPARQPDPPSAPGAGRRSDPRRPATPGPDRDRARAGGLRLRTG